MVSGDLMNCGDAVVIIAVAQLTPNKGLGHDKQNDDRQEFQGSELFQMSRMKRSNAATRSHGAQIENLLCPHKMIEFERPAHDESGYA